MSDVSLPHRIHLMEEKLKLLDQVLAKLANQGTPAADLQAKLAALEAKYKMLNARIARKQQ